MDKSVVNQLKELYKKWSGEEALMVMPLPESGSNRKYFRISGRDHKAVGTFNPDERENNAFLYLSGHLRKYDVYVPEIYQSDLANHIYLQEDLGDTSLFEYQNVLKNESGATDKLKELLKKVIYEMPKFQVRAASDLDFSICYPRAAFDRQSIMWDLNYFKYYFIKLVKVPFYEQDLENDFIKLADFLLEADSQFFLYRDFQSRNIMLKDNKICFIDYQGGRRGALQYDLASFLFEAKTELSPSLREELLEYYLSVLPDYLPQFDRKSFIDHYYGYVLIRIMQALGAYGYRGYFERKPLFLQSIPPALKNLEWVINHIELPVKLPELYKVFRQLVTSRQFDIPLNKEKGLTVLINSFSYKKGGIPPDFSENGGGFVFDCRALPNPGRYPEYKEYTGKDKPVIDFLEKEKEVKNFLENIYLLVDASVENYIDRRFNRLMISFGCTGGQHRSVFAAEKLKQHLMQKYKIGIVLNHTEQADSKNNR